MRCPALPPIGEQVPQLDTAVCPDALNRYLVVAQQFDQRRPAYPQQVRRLLGGQHHRLRNNGNRQTVLHGLNDLEEHLLYLGGIHLVIGIGTGLGGTGEQQRLVRMAAREGGRGFPPVDR